MKRHGKYLVKGIIFTVILIALIHLTNRLLIPKYYFTNIWPTTSGLSGFYQMERDSIDVLFLGSSVAEAQFIPQVLYNDYGIRSYNLACEQQNLVTSYYWLKEVLRFQKPSVVIVDTYMLFPINNYEPLNSAESCTRKAMDSMKWSSVKWDAVHDICYYDPKQSLMSYYFPNIRYHTRWSHLSEEDFTFAEMEKHYELKGYAPLTGQLRNYDFIPFSASDSNEREEMVTLMREYLDRIVELCDENDITLILVKTPAVAEDIKKYNTVTDFAVERNIDFLDFNEETYYNDCGFVFARDMNDDVHANIWGAEKLSHYMADKLYNDFGIGGGEHYEQWKDTNEYYQKIYQDCELTQITDLNEYIDAINQDRYTTLIAIKGRWKSFLTEEALEDFRRLGIQMDYEDGFSYYAVIQNGNIEEKGSMEKLVYCGSTRNQLTDYKMVSMGYKSGIECSIKINNVEYAKNIYGINIVVYNNETMKVIDSVGFNGEIVR